MKIRINLSRQTLELFDDSGKCLRNYAVSTSKMGPGEQRGSFRTPRGRQVTRRSYEHLGLPVPTKGQGSLF